jgi:hypothetical protein
MWKTAMKGSIMTNTNHASTQADAFTFPDRMTHAQIRQTHFQRLNSYRNSAEYAQHANEIGADIPPGELPSLIGNRWEIDEQTYREFLNVLPPLGWRNGTFYLSEFTFGDITTKYTKDGDKYFCEFARFPERKPPAETPWGHPDTIKQIAEGITWYSTPSHGGYHLSPERMQAMPEHLRNCSFTRDHWFEEDCSWCAVVLAFPEHFPEEDQKVAQLTYETVYAGKLTGVGAIAANAKARIRS